ncbi:MAG: S41 family peptidase [Planctomycetota bacterium]
MSKTSGRQAFLAYAMGVVAGVLGTLIWKQWFPDPEDRDVREYREVRDFVASTFVRSLDKQELLERSLRGMTRSLDPYSRYYDRAESDEFEQETQGNYPGIGVVMRQVEGRARVLFAVPGSPADRAGLLSGDAILSVDGVKSADLPWDEFAEHMRGPAGSLVALELQGTDGALRSVEVPRGLVPDPSVRHVEWLDVPGGTSYISVHGFSRRTPDEFDRAMSEMEPARALVLDLRDNLGGVMESAVAIADRFLSTGEILRTESRTASESHVAKEGTTLWPDLPMVVLVNGSSASAAEILAASLQDHRRAVLLGEPTYGKGVVQEIRRFPEFGTRAKVTSAYYYSPSGRLFERSAEAGRTYGIMPDVRVELTAGEQNGVRDYLAGYGTPKAVREALHTWQTRESVPQADYLPRDRQVLAALELLADHRPEPRD